MFKQTCVLVPKLDKLPGLVIILLAGLSCSDSNSLASRTTEDFASPGQKTVLVESWEVMDASRDRRIPVLTWSPGPDDGQPPYPLIIANHGGGGKAIDNESLGQLLASHGYIVAAPEYPGASDAASGATLDLVAGPTYVEDTRFVLDALLGVNAQLSEYSAAIDPDRIGLVGGSYGGMLGLMSTYHPRLQDTRLRALAVKFAPIGFALTPEFFFTSDAPLLWIHGTRDALVHYPSNAPVVFDIADDTHFLLTLKNGNHVLDLEDNILALVEGIVGSPVVNPDKVGCVFTAANSPGDAFVTQWGDIVDGILPPSDSVPTACSYGAEDLPVLDIATQIRLSEAAIVAFFDSRFDASRGARRAATNFLQNTFNDENSLESEMQSEVAPGYAN